MYDKYKWDAERKTIIGADGSDLSINDVIDHLNQLFFAVEAFAVVWRELSDITSYLDQIFLGAGAGLPEDIEGSTDDTGSGEVDDEGRPESDTEGEPGEGGLDGSPAGRGETSD